MIALWGAIALLTLVAVAVVFWPLLKAGRVHKEAVEERLKDRQHQNIDIYRERLAELENERRIGTLDDKNFEVLKLELERNLLIDAETEDRALKHPRPNTAQLVTVVLLALLIPVSALGLYQHLGRAADLEVALNPPKAPETLEEAIAQLVQELERHPENAEGWYLLANTYVNQGRFDEGLAAFRKVLEVLPKEAPQYSGVQGQIAQALYFKAGGKMTDEVSKQIDLTLSLDPNDLAALGLLGIDAYESENYSGAMEYWGRALKSASGDAAESLRTGIEQARQQLIAAGKPVPDIPELKQPRILVSVDISDELKAKLSPEQTLFIYARPVGGRMPLAAVRRKASELPLQVELNDSMAMMAGSGISSVDEVEIGARISSSGQAISAPGDLIGSLSPVAVTDGAQSVELVIDRVVE